MVTMVVQGSAVRRVEAEHARITLTVRVDDRDSAAAMSGAVAVHERILGRLRDLERAGAVADWSAPRVRLSWTQRYDDDPARSARWFTAATTIGARFTDFTALGAWTVELADLESVEFDGIDWLAGRERMAQAEREVRTAAVLDARERADSYAAGLGLTSVAPVRLDETGASSCAGPPVTAARMSVIGPGGAELKPEDIEVHAAVAIMFRAEER